MTAASRTARPSPWRRWFGIVLRTLHLAGVTWLGAALAGAPFAPWLPGLAAAASGAALLAVEVADGRLVLNELAGGVSLVKLAVVGWMALDAAAAPWLFWIVLVASGLSAHAPRAVRHWRLRRGLPRKEDRS